jgi:hypothetical protein
VDSYGDRYVSVAGAQNEGGEGRIDVFDASGVFLSEVPLPTGPEKIAVDSKGVLYICNFPVGALPRISRLTPTVFKPEAGEIEYEQAPVNLGIGCPNAGFAVNPANDHLFRTDGAEHSTVFEFGSAEEGNQPLPNSFSVPGRGGYNLTIDAAGERIYVQTLEYKDPVLKTGLRSVVRVFDLEGSHQLLTTIDGSSTPSGEFFSVEPTLAVDEETGHLFVGELSATKRRIQELDRDGAYISTIEHKFEFIGAGQIAVDNSLASAAHGYLYVASGEGSVGHSYAFRPYSPPKPPVVEGVSVNGVTLGEAVLQATVAPKGLPGTYRFEYTSQQRFEEEGFAAAALAGAGSADASNEALDFSATARGLSPGTAYRFRLVFETEAGSDEMEGSFATFAAPDAFTGCANGALRSGLSAALPDCRAYELVTPPSTNGLAPYGLHHLGTYFPTREASPVGDKMSFEVAGGALSGIGGTGTLAGDSYLATRGPDGWSTASAGPDGTQAPASLPGSVSPDQGHSFFSASGGGTLTIGGTDTSYVRYADGRIELLGHGSIADDPRAKGKLISENGGHIIFASSKQLEPAAPPDGTSVIYDRTADGTNHVVSLLPGELTPAVGQTAAYEGASLDGRGVAFRLAGTLYLRRDDAQTYEVGSGVAFAGVAEGGGRIFYLQGGDLWRLDAEGGARTAFTASGDVTVVNISADGSTAYFVSPSALTAAGANPRGDLPVAGGENLYRSREGEISFVATVSESDVAGNPGAGGGGNGGFETEGLGLWLRAVNGGEIAIDPSRTTPDGGVLLFESGADLGGFGSADHRQIYRYSVAGSLACLSCNPTGAASVGGEANLQSINKASDSPEPLNQFALTTNLRPDGKRAFFESTEGLVLSDTDGLRDVYEWEDKGVGSCRASGGCLYLISSGSSSREDYLYAVSDSGDDVFFRTADLLLPALDPDETPSIYDARVGGGFAPPSTRAGECLGDACQPTVSPPADPVQNLQGAGNVRAEGSSRCPKGKRLIRKGKKHRCVQRQRKHRHRGDHAGRRTKP